MEGAYILNSRALTKIQSMALAVVIVFASIGGVAIYFLLGEQEQQSENIMIGVCADIDFGGGKAMLQGAILAAEQVNSEGGILGRNITIVAEDDDSLSKSEPEKASQALTKLITVDKADFIIYSGMIACSIYQEIVAEHKKILFHYGDNSNSLTQKVSDDYDRYKYYFRYSANSTAGELLRSKVYAVVKEYTGFTKVAVWKSDQGGEIELIDSEVTILNELGFDVVHTAGIPYETVDFSSHFAQAEARGAEIVIPWIFSITGAFPIINEYNVRESPTVLWGLPYVGRPISWEYTDGKCNYLTGPGSSFVAGYPFTSKVIPTREAYYERWGEEIDGDYIAFAYDVVRFILPDAIERAGTSEIDAVIAALEKTEIEETSLYQDFAFTTSHDLLITDNEDHIDITYFQWQNGELVPVYPKEMMEEAGATFMFPDWAGPWDNID